MYQESGKKIIILYILNILRKYTDANHPMTQQQIVEKLLSDYGMEVNRSTKRPGRRKRPSSTPTCTTSMTSRNRHCIC